MEIIKTIAEGTLRYLMTFRIADYLDIALITYGIYWLLKVVGRTRAVSLGKGVAIFLLALWLSDLLTLYSVNFILTYMVQVGILALVVLFQPEIRRLLEQLGSSQLSRLNPFSHLQQTTSIETAITQTVMACADMSASRTGALIVFERENKLDDYTRQGTIVDAQVSDQLLKNIFFVKAALHDGAVIIRDGRLLAAGCVLPLSHNVNLSRDLGTRHRAGVGMSENSDAVVVIVSEETGAISAAVGGMLKRHLMAETLEKLLRSELMPHDEEENQSGERFWQRLPVLRRLRKGDGADDAHQRP